ncbi:exocyst complex component sec8 [Rhizoctonia solani AG-1 IA]|uniref:Exocyst complex component Sec8 n=1 Tax=Thanatephorus cucumeris (strain AG1-IA) TaxID=983506 RepID=L8X2Q3_THACA|nr:exocyst complex component sec8 [Rhizoctonia solani AG-1 IA]
MSRTPRTRGSRSRDRGSEDFSRSNGYTYETPPLPITRPLQPRPRVPSITGGYTSDRDRDRFGTSPSNSRMHYDSPSRASPAPSRPARSERRPINSVASDSFRQTHSSRPSIDDDADPYGGVDALPITQPQFQDDHGEPKALGSVISAFQIAGYRHAAAPDKERERLIEQTDRIREREPGRAIKGRRGTIGEIDGKCEGKFNPVSLALALLDDSSVGRDLDSFRRTKGMLERALKGTVDTFAASLPHHSKLINLLTETQKHIAETRSCLIDARAALSHQRADLVQLWSRGQTIEEMLRILDEIDRLKNIPDQLESLMSEKKLLQAALLLVRSQKTITNAELMDIGALTDLRSYLSGQETVGPLFPPSRWAAYKPGQESLPDLGPGSSSNDELPIISPFGAMPQALAKYLTDLNMRPVSDAPFSVSDDPRQSVVEPPGSRTHSRNPSLSARPTSVVDPTPTVKTPDNIESNSFLYIEMLLEALAVLGSLGGALDTVNQRLNVEIFTLVESVISDVHERAEFVRRGLEQSQPGAGNTGSGGGIYVFVGEGPGALRLAALEGAAKKVDHEILRDLCWTLYSKLDAVVQGRDFKDASGINPGQLFPLANAWSSIRSEVRNLLHDQISDEGSGVTAGRNPISSINEILRTGKFGRDKTKGAFHFADTDPKPVNRALRTHEEGITQVLRATVPGLITSLAGEASAGTQFTTGPDASEHRLLVRPDAFHVSVLFQPTLAFLERAAACLPDGVAEGVGGMGGGSLFLDDFVVRVYLPQLEEKVSDLFHQAVGGLDAFHEDTHSGRISEQPLVKASMQLMALINSLCIMLQATPLHRENYARLILGVIIQFYQRCYERFLDLVSRSTFSGENSSIAAKWAQRPEVAACLGELYSTPLHEINQRRTLCKQETRVELTFLANAIVGKDDLLPHVRDLTALGSLYRSLTWFITQLLGMKLTLNDAPATLNDPRASPKPPPSPRSPAQVPNSPFSPRIPLEVIQSSYMPSDSLRLPLSRAMAQRFDAIMKTYDQLAELTLSTIRIDVRCRVMHYLHTGVQSVECKQPDPFVQDLNTSLIACDDAINGVLPEVERRFIFDGIGGLVEHLLVSNSRFIRFANDFGIQKMLRNLSALRQNLKTITGLPEDFELSQAQAYYNLFDLGPTACRLCLNGYGTIKCLGLKSTNQC